ncbi:MAG TPA: dihydrofolate reductase family protein [Ktedonobacterales bacterium]|jgi:dihydrofolate reductase|nr:dihydrofolate reductase family protein [Ktedonobacterales bacterium]
MTMGKIVVSEFVSLDGVMEDPGGAEGTKHGGWTFPFGSPEQEQFKAEELVKADALLLGRRTYQGFAAAWPSMEGTGAYGEKMNSMPKYVVSTTLADSNVTWNATLLKGDLAQELARIKQEVGQDILIFGSGQLVHSMVAQSLIDEYRLMVFPVILGSGKRVFPEADEKTTLTLVESKPFASGVMVLTYRPAKS